jgi:hypothetical protein
MRGLIELDLAQHVWIPAGLRLAAGAVRPWDRFSPPSPPHRIGYWIPTDLLNDVEEAAARLTDATSFAADGSPKIIIDWKSDVDPAAETVEHYRVVVRSYLRTMGKPDGLIVFVTTGIILRVSPLVDQKAKPLAVGS